MNLQKVILLGESEVSKQQMGQEKNEAFGYVIHKQWLLKG